MAQVVPDVKAMDAKNAAVTFPGPLSGNSSITVVLTAKLSVAATYTGSVRLSYDGVSRVPIALKVVRSRVAPSVTIDPIGAVDVDQGASAKIVVTFKETRGIPVHVTSVNAFAVDRKLSGATRRVNAPGVWLDSSKEDKDTPFDVPAGGGSTKLRIEGFSDPGEYTGMLRFVTTDGLPAEAAFTAVVRGSGKLAFVLILVGIFAALLLKWLTTLATTTVAVVRRSAALLRLLDDIEPTPAPGSTAAELRAKLNPFTSYGRIAASTQADTQTLDDLERRVAIFRSWSALRRRVDADTSLSPPPELDDVRDFLARLELADAAMAAAAAAKLNAVHDKVDVQLRYRGPRDELAQAAQEWLDSHPDRPAGMDGVKAALAQLSTAIGSGDESAAWTARDAAHRA